LGWAVWCHIAGEPDRPPRVGISIGDSLSRGARLHGNAGGLHHRERTGVGQVVDAAIW
jgi:crotonobetainyl-CoA:carnitine CoA-transferase CaiB-like acyl-CoA transferase